MLGADADGEPNLLSLLRRQNLDPERAGEPVVIRLDDHVGLHSGMRGLRSLWQQGQLAVVQGVGYPNPERSHFEAMDIWQSADSKGKTTTGWLGRAAVESEHASRI